jgi:hypothetical protein
MRVQPRAALAQQEAIGRAAAGALADLSANPAVGLAYAPGLEAARLTPREMGHARSGDHPLERATPRHGRR